MTTQTCPECTTVFEPRRTTLLYCSPKCSARSRARRRRVSHRTTTQVATQTTIAVERANSNARLLASERRHQLRFAVETAELNAKSQDALMARDRVIDAQQSQLQRLNAKHMALCSQLAESKAECVELKLEVARHIKDRRADLQDLMQIAVRMLQLTDNLGIPP